MSTTVHHDTTNVGTGYIQRTKRDVIVRIDGKPFTVPAGTMTQSEDIRFGPWSMKAAPWATVPDIAFVAPDLSPVHRVDPVRNADGLVIQALSNLNAKLICENADLREELANVRADLTHTEKAYREELNRLREQEAVLTLANTSLRTTNDDLESLLDDFDAENKALRAELEAVRDALVDSRHENAHWADRIAVALNQ
jgi:hypothetical protein